MRSPIAVEGLFLASVPLVLGALLFAFGGHWAGTLGRSGLEKLDGYLWALAIRWVGAFLVVVGVAVTLFFRDPRRTFSGPPGAVLSPADGTLIVAEKVREEGTLKGEALKLSVFMTVFNVHVNRIPFDGTVLSVRRVSGAFVPADRPEASSGNNRVEVLLEDGKGRRALLVQVTGLIARRIICRLQPGDRVRRGERFGLICFGSRLDLFLPPEALPGVPVGAKVRAGETVFANW